MEVIFGTDELQALNAALADITIQGERLPPAVLAFGGVEAPLKQRGRDYELCASG